MDVAMPRPTRSRLPRAAAAIASTLSRLIVMSAATMIHIASQKDAPPQPGPVVSGAGRTSLTAIHTSRTPPVRRRNGMRSNTVTMPTKTMRSITAPTVPHTWPSMRCRGGSRRTASAITTALSPDRSRFKKPISSRPAQKCGSARVLIRAVLEAAYLSWRPEASRLPPQAAPPRREDRQEEEEDRHEADRAGDGPGEEDRERPMGHDQALAERILREIPEHEGQHQRRQRVIELLEHVADDAEQQHVPHVDHAVVHRVRP